MLIGIQIYGASHRNARLPILAFDHRHRSIPEISRHLRAQGIEVAAGLQCAPMAHDILGTAPEGVIRLSVGPMNTQADLATGKGDPVY